eukprot:SAG22_NODE_4586_length_1225_cov_1.333037_1_plen_131_part_10
MDLGFEYSQLAEHIDFFFLMCYGDNSPNGSMFTGIAHADNPLRQLAETLRSYPAAREKLVLGLPWYSLDYTCNAGTAATQRVCNVSEFFQTHNPVGDRARSLPILLNFPAVKGVLSLSLSLSLCLSVSFCR